MLAVAGRCELLQHLLPSLMAEFSLNLHGGKGATPQSSWYLHHALWRGRSPSHPMQWRGRSPNPANTQTKIISICTLWSVCSTDILLFISTARGSAIRASNGQKQYTGILVVLYKQSVTVKNKSTITQPKEEFKFIRCLKTLMHLKIKKAQKGLGN